MADGAIGYLLKMFPRFSETFILDELLELGRQGVPLDIFSLKRPNDGVIHADVARLRARVTYLPQSPLDAPGAIARAHRQAFQAAPHRYLGAVRAAVRRPSRATPKHFLRAGYIAPLLGRHRLMTGLPTAATELEALVGRPAVARRTA